MHLYFLPKKMLIYGRLFKRGFKQNKIMKQTFVLLNEDATGEILYYLKYNHITDTTMNAYLYVFIYELLYLSIWLHICPKEERKKILDKSFIHIVLYLFIKVNSELLLKNHSE